MKAFWKIPKEWVQDWGLSWSEAGVLADILSYPECSFRERASRCGVSIGTISACIATYNKKQICSKIEHPNVQILNTLCSNSEQKRSKNEQKCSNSELPPITPYIEEEKKKEKNITPKGVSDAIAPTDKKTSPKKKKKYSDEETKLHGELKTIFDEEWVSAFGDSFYWDGAEMAGLVRIKKQIQFKMKSNECDPNDTEQIKFNFRFFIHKILTSLDSWTKENSSPKTIAGRFNVIYNQLKNGKSSSNAADNFHVFGSRNITPDILAEFA